MIYMYVLNYKLYGSFWRLPSQEKESINSLVVSYIDENIKNGNLINVKYYKSLRYDSDIIFWASTNEPLNIARLKENLNGIIGDYGYPQYSMLSLYEESPYIKEGQKLEDTLKTEPKKYFVAYPMSKDREWYLLNYEERRKIMSGHIGAARSDKEGHDILSYTTYSFGLGDQEFVVLYETDSLSAWSHVTEHLREVLARKWIIKEEPIFVGIYNGRELLI